MWLRTMRDHALAQLGRIAKPLERLLGELRADLLVASVRVAALRVVVQPAVGAAPGDVRLAEVVEERREPHAQREPARRRPPARPRTCARRRSASCQRLSCSNPIAGSNSGRRCTSTPVSRASRSAFAGCAPSSSFDSSPIPSAARPPPIRSPETSSTLAASSRICASVCSSGSRPSCETNRRPRTSRSGSSAKLDGETVRSVFASRSARPPCGSTSVAVGEAPRHRVDGEVAAREILLDASPRDRRRSRSRAVPARSSTSRRGGASSMPARASFRTSRVARIEADADRPAGDDELLRAAVRLERGAQPLDVDPGDEEVGVLRLAARAARRAPRRRRRTRPARASRRSPRPA